MKSISLIFDDQNINAELLDSPTAQAIYKVLPIEAEVHVWGEEIYFDVPVVLDQEPNAKEEVEVGDLGFWPVGSAFCIFFGKTPVSTSEKPRAYSPVNVFGRITGDLELLKRIKQGTTVKVLING